MLKVFGPTYMHHSLHQHWIGSAHGIGFIQIHPKLIEIIARLKCINKI